MSVPIFLPSSTCHTAPLCFPPNTARPHTGQLRVAYCFSPNMVVAGAAPPRSLRRVSAVSLLLQGTAAPLLQVLPRFASPPACLSNAWVACERLNVASGCEFCPLTTLLCLRSILKVKLGTSAFNKKKTRVEKTIPTRTPQSTRTMEFSSNEMK